MSEIKLDWDFKSAKTHLFIDGVRHPNFWSRLKDRFPCGLTRVLYKWAMKRAQRGFWAKHGKKYGKMSLRQMIGASCKYCNADIQGTLGMGEPHPKDGSCLLWGHEHDPYSKSKFPR